MDTFFEQIIKVKRSSAQKAGVFGIWLLAFVITVLVVLFVIGSAFTAFGLLIIFGAVWGANKLAMLSSIEYEYIFTNGDLDVDKIIAKSSRKRMVSINCSKVEKYGKYNAAARPSDSIKNIYFFCDKDDERAVYLIAPNKNEGNVMIVFAPDERIREVIEKAIPRVAR